MKFIQFGIPENIPDSNEDKILAYIEHYMPFPSYLTDCLSEPSTRRCGRSENLLAIIIFRTILAGSGSVRAASVTFLEIPIRSQHLLLMPLTNPLSPCL